MAFLSRPVCVRASVCVRARVCVRACLLLSFPLNPATRNLLLLCAGKTGPNPGKPFTDLSAEFFDPICCPATCIEICAMARGLYEAPGVVSCLACV